VPSVGSCWQCCRRLKCLTINLFITKKYEKELLMFKQNTIVVKLKINIILLMKRTFAEINWNE
jgi:hypothetical protein